MIKRCFLFLLLSLYCCYQSFADLYPILLRMDLAAVKDTYSVQEPIVFRLGFTNNSTKPYSILLPGNKKNGSKLIYLSVFTIEGNSYREIARESREILMPGIPQPTSGNLFKYIQPGQTTTIPLFVNDTIQYKRHIEAQHLLQGLGPGRYAVLAWYDPWSDTLSAYVFNKKSPFKKDQVLDTNKLTLPEEGLNSNYASIVITAGKPVEQKTVPTAFCPLHCRLCQAIEKEKWHTVQNIISRQTYCSGKHKEQNTDSSWRMPHRNITWLSDMPFMIQASLPAYTSRNFIFKNSKGYHYFYASWQLGIIYKNRSRLRSMLYMLGFRPRFSTSNTGYYKLISFRPY
ncbi:MAG TPA: hypothetical protein VL092_03660 [Chitinophagaceae bacterium]|nr:hypothetical protein [Chitinophagaceae bacterium]